MAFIRQFGFVCSFMCLPFVALANLYEEADRAYQDFLYAYARLPSGVCEGPRDAPLRPYRDALERLLNFEYIAQDLPDKPDTGEIKWFLEDIVDYGNDACVSLSAGISFRCSNPPCPQPMLDYSYLEAPEAPAYEVVQPRRRADERPQRRADDEPLRRADEQPQRRSEGRGVDGYSVTLVAFDNGGWMEMDGRGNWNEFGPGGDRVARFKEVARDEWSVYLEDRGRNYEMQIDLHTKWVMLGDIGERLFELYRIEHGE